MDNIKELQQELLNQKAVIESKSGYVVVANQNPSPYEITEAIKTIPSTDLSNATATEADVARGKTFYAGNSIIKTGVALTNQHNVDAIFMPNLDAQSTEEQLYYSFPTGYKQTRKYNFYLNKNKVQITFNPELTLIDEYSFYKASNFTFLGLSELTNLNRISAYAFAYSNGEGIDFSNLPSSLTYLGSSCFHDLVSESRDYTLSENLTYLGQSAFRRETRTLVNNLDISKYKYSNLPPYAFYNLAFNCDLIIPETVTYIGTYFNYSGGFHHIEIPASVTSLENYCFGVGTNQPLSNAYLKTITFYGEKVPNFGSLVIGTNYITNGLKIYVPDNVIDEYKTKTNFSRYADNIYPLSEKE